MPTHESAEKRMRQNAKRRMRNKAVRTRLTTVARKFREQIEAGDIEAAAEQIREVESTYDRAVSKGVIPRKRASRKVSRLKKSLSAAQADK